MADSKRFTVTVKETSLKNGDINALTAREKIFLKKYDDSTRLDEVVTPNESIEIVPENYAVLSVHNEMSENPDYEVYLIIASDGQKYVTSSPAFWSEFNDIFSDMSLEGEPFELKCYKKESKNYKGKYFLTCSLVM